MKNPGRGALALLGSLTLGAGVGLAMAGQGPRALRWFGVAAIALCLLVLTVWMLPIAFAIWIAWIVDTYRQAAASPRPLRLLDPWVGIMIAATLGGALALRATVVEAFKIPASSMYPTLHIGDHIFIDKLTPHIRAIEPGELVVFVYPCNRDRDYIKRVIATGGQSVEVRCNVVYVDGKALPSTLVTADDHYDDLDDREGRWFSRATSRYHEEVNGHGFDTFHDPDRPERDKRHATAPATDGDTRDFPYLDRGRQPPSCRNSEDWSQSADSETLGKIVEGTRSENPCDPQLHYVVPEGHLFVLGDNRGNSNDSRVWGSVPVDFVKGRVTGIWLAKGANGYDWKRFGSVR